MAMSGQPFFLPRAFSSYSKQILQHQQLHVLRVISKAWIDAASIDRGNSKLQLRACTTEVDVQKFSLFDYHYQVARI
jgi:hypothetical protein